MNAYLAIGHYKGNKNITCVAEMQTTKKEFMTDCYGNEFVPYVVITEKTFAQLSACDYDEDKIYEIVKKMTSNFRIWATVTDFIYQCFDFMAEKMQAAKEQG